MGPPEIAVIVVVALLIFGPDKLPDLARQAGRFIRTVKQMADNAKADLSKELGPEFADLNLQDLDPRAVVRDTILNDTPESTKPSPAKRSLRPGEVPPFDPEST